MLQLPHSLIYWSHLYIWIVQTIESLQQAKTQQIQLILTSKNLSREFRMYLTVYYHRNVMNSFSSINDSSMTKKQPPKIEGSLTNKKLNFKALVQQQEFLQKRLMHIFQNS